MKTYKCFALLNRRYTRGILLLLIATVLSIAGNAQRFELRIGIQKGANKILIGDGFHETKIGHSTTWKIDFALHGKNSKFSFEPSLFTVKHFYFSRIEENVSVKNAQRSIGLMLMTGIALKENFTLKFGLFAQGVVSTSVDIVSKNGTTTSSFGSSALYETYAARNFQAGVAASVEYAFGEKKRWGIDLGVQQFATSFLEKNYLLNFSTTATGTTVVFTGKSLPTVVMMGIFFKII